MRYVSLKRSNRFEGAFGFQNRGIESPPFLAGNRRTKLSCLEVRFDRGAGLFQFQDAPNDGAKRGIGGSRGALVKAGDGTHFASRQRYCLDRVGNDVLRRVVERMIPASSERNALHARYLESAQEEVSVKALQRRSGVVVEFRVVTGSPENSDDATAVCK